MATDSTPMAERSSRMLECAVQIFARDGFAATDVQHIANAAGVGKGTVYRHFGSKEKLFLEAARYVRNQVHDEAEAQADDAATPLERLCLGIKGFVNYFHRHPEVVELLIQERANFRDKTPTFFDDTDRRNEKWVALFQQLIDEGVLRDLPIPQIQAALSRFVFGSMFVTYLGGAQLHEQNEKAIFDVLMNGLLAKDSNAKAD